MSKCPSLMRTGCLLKAFCSSLKHASDREKAPTEKEEEEGGREKRNLFRLQEEVIVLRVP